MVVTKIFFTKKQFIDVLKEIAGVDRIWVDQRRNGYVIVFPVKLTNKQKQDITDLFMKDYYIDFEDEYEFPEG